MTKFKQLGFYIDQANCTGCKACQTACNDKHDLPVGVKWRRVAEYAGGATEQDDADGTFRANVFSYYTSISCNHCEVVRPNDAPTVSCPGQRCPRSAPDLRR